MKVHTRFIWRGGSRFCHLFLSFISNYIIYASKGSAEHPSNSQTNECRNSVKGWLLRLPPFISSYSEDIWHIEWRATTTTSCCCLQLIPLQPRLGVGIWIFPYEFQRSFEWRWNLVKHMKTTSTNYLTELMHSRFSLYIIPKLKENSFTISLRRGHLMPWKKACCLISCAPLLEPSLFAGSLCRSPWMSCRADKLAWEMIMYKHKLQQTISRGFSSSSLSLHFSFIYCR